MQVLAAAAVGSRTRAGRAEPWAVGSLRDRARDEVAWCSAGRGRAARRSLFPRQRRGGAGTALGSAGPPRLADGLALSLPPFLPRRR